MARDMRNFEEVGPLIDAITSAVGYEGDYGDRIFDVASLLTDVDEAERDNVPADYLEFMAVWGYGELDAAFYVDPAPVKYSSVVGIEVAEYSGMYVFAGNSSDLLYAFDSSNHWSVVEICSETDGFDPVSMRFSDFIVEQLKYIKGLVYSRAAY